MNDLKDLPSGWEKKTKGNVFSKIIFSLGLFLAICVWPSEGASNESVLLYGLATAFMMLLGCLLMGHNSD